MATDPVKELHLGPVETKRDVQIALQEIVTKMNEVIRRLNTLLP